MFTMVTSFGTYCYNRLVMGWGNGIVIASFAMHSDGKIPDVQVEKIEKWLRRRSTCDERALRALPVTLSCQ